MAVTIQVNGQKSTIKNYNWSGNEILSRTLNANMPLSLPLASSPNHDRIIAKDAIKHFGGKIISATKPKYVKGRIY